MSIYVGNLSYQVTEEDLHEVFKDYGTVKRVTVPIDREKNRMRGFAFVEMSSDEQEQSAITALDGAEWMGRQLKVNKARPREAQGQRNRDHRDNRESKGTYGGGRKNPNGGW